MSRPRTILALIDLVQDLDVMLPVLVVAAQRPGLRLRILVSGYLAWRSPRTPRLLKASGLAFGYVHRPHLLAGRSPSFEGIDLLLTAAESSAGPHRWMYAVTGRADAAGVATFTLQHGLDNLEMLKGAGGRRLRSRTMFCWPEAAHIPAGIPPDVHARLAPVGRPMLPAEPTAPVFDLGVFENLHSPAYSEDQRQSFLDNLVGLARARPALRLYVRSHPAGGWLDGFRKPLSRLSNLVLEPSRTARRLAGAPGKAAALAARVVTTPSTIALDAAQAARPVGLALEGGAAYAGLRVLGGLSDWVDFADGPAEPGPLEAAFVARHVRPGDSIGRILDQLSRP